MQDCKHHWIVDSAGSLAACRECGASKVFGAATSSYEAVESGKPGEHLIPSLESVMTLRGLFQDDIRWGRYGHPEAQALAL